MTAGTEIMPCGWYDKIEAVIDVGENDITRVSLGDTVIVEVDATMAGSSRALLPQIEAVSVAISSSVLAFSTNQRCYQL